ncbi:MAG: bifunctional folylpolyglutamate synthase/dihydrofolate synthase [Cyclobacteriaceae bacterium]
MNYQESLDFLYSRLPMFQRVGAPALKYNLDNTIALLSALGDPHKSLKSIHIAGTNGKGSSAHSLSAILQESGLKVGLFTSPHLKSFTERARINGTPVAERYVSHFVTDFKEVIEDVNPSFFELTFGMSMLYFQEQQVDVAVIETGLGGRLDSTNVINPEVCLITSIGLDHTDLLGDTLEEIAMEKAGIIKPNTPVVIGADQPDILHVFKNKAVESNSVLHGAGGISVLPKPKKQPVALVDVVIDGDCVFSDMILDIGASYFRKNLPGVLKVVEVLRDQGWTIFDQAIRNGLQNVTKLSGLRGRFQVIKTSPHTIADISHNLQGLTELFSQVDKMYFSELHIVFGVVKDKSIDEILLLLSKLKAEFYFTQSSVPRSMSSLELKKLAANHMMNGEAFGDVNMAIKEASHRASAGACILICGSTFVVAEIDNL